MDQPGRSRDVLSRLALAGFVFGSVSCQALLDLGTQPSDGGSVAADTGPTSPDAAAPDATACGDVRRDPLHCGRCGHSCLGDPCIEGACQPTALATPAGGGYGIDVDDQYVYWSSTAAPALFRIAKNATNGASIPLLERPDGFLPLDVRVDGLFVAVVNARSGNGTASAFRVGIDGGVPFEIGVGCAYDGNSALAVDSSSVYFVNGTAGAVNRAAKVTGGCESIVTGQGTPSSVVVDATSVFFTNKTSTTGGLMTAPKSGGTPTAIASELIAAARGVAMDADTLFVATNDGRIVRVNKDGTGFGELANGGLEPTHLAVDAKTVFWTDSGQVWATDKTVSAPRVIASNQPDVAAVAVDRDRVYWATSTSIMRMAK